MFDAADGSSAMVAPAPVDKLARAGLNMLSST
jgi:hypothetical protein